MSAGAVFSRDCGCSRLSIAGKQVTKDDMLNCARPTDTQLYTLARDRAARERH